MDMINLICTKCGEVVSVGATHPERISKPFICAQCRIRKEEELKTIESLQRDYGENLENQIQSLKDAR